MKSHMYDALYQQDRTHWWFRAKREIVLELLESALTPETERTLIDFGCGCGLMLQELQRYGQVSGADISEQALAYCRTRFSGPLMLLDLSRPMEPEQQYHFGVALDILEHIPAEETAAENLYRLLLPGGQCIVTVPANPWMWSTHDENCMHVRRYSKEHLQTLLTNAGFQVDYISYYNFWLFPAISVARLITKWFHLDRNSSLENSVRDGWRNRLLYRIFRSETSRIRCRRTFPAGVSLIALVSKAKTLKEDPPYVSEN